MHHETLIPWKFEAIQYYDLRKVCNFVVCSIREYQPHAKTYSVGIEDHITHKRL